MTSRRYINLLRRDGNITLVGASEKPLAVTALGLLFACRSLSGSPIGGIPETQEMLDFYVTHNSTADVDVIPVQKVNEAYDRLLKSDVKYRFSTEMAALKSEYANCRHCAQKRCGSTVAELSCLANRRTTPHLLPALGLHSWIICQPFRSATTRTDRRR